MNVEEVQRSLWEQSMKHKENRDSSLPMFPVNQYDERIRNLMDLMHHPIWLRAAASRVLTRSQGKTQGIDKMTVHQFEKNYEKNIENLRLELKRGTYRPSPVRQAMIPKANGKMRALGIPCLRDKIVQEAMRMALEPIFEVEFHEDSYGFRPNRSAHHAIVRCQQLMQKKFTWVIEGDVKACFDEISHKTILKVIREKVMDNKFLALVELFLKAGISVNGKIQPTERGVPQGGVISPLLANAVLNKLDRFLHNKGVHGAEVHKAYKHQQTNIRFVRYADDWCVFITRGSKRIAETLRNEISEFLYRECGLRLSQEKTLITHVRDGFNFLGFQLLLGVGKKGKYVPKIRVGKKGVENLKERINEETRRVPHHTSISARIYRASLVIKGWGAYYCLAHNYLKVAADMDHHIFWILVKAICRTMNCSTAQCLKEHYRKGTITYKGEESLAKLHDRPRMVGLQKPKPYLPGGINVYETDNEMEEDKHYNSEVHRPGNSDMKLTVLKRDNHRCRKCGREVNAKNSQLDHIVPVKSFPNLQMANKLENLQTLCLECHKLKHQAKRRKKND
jgi:RNA-directed DNA polymerase